MTGWRKVSFSSHHANQGMGVQPGEGGNVKTSQHGLQHSCHFFFLMTRFIFVTFECQLGIPYFSKHKNQAMSTQGSASLPLWLASYRAVCENRLLRLLNQGWKCFKIHLVWGSCFPVLRLEPRVRTPWASTLPLGYTLNLFGDLLMVLIL